MNTFALDKNYSQINFEEISVDELEIISGGTGVANVNDGLSSGYYTALQPAYYTYFSPVDSRLVAAKTYNTQTYTYSYPSSSGTLTNTGTGSTFA